MKSGVFRVPIINWLCLGLMIGIFLGARSTPATAAGWLVGAALAVVHYLFKGDNKIRSCASVLLAIVAGMLLLWSRQEQHSASSLEDLYGVQARIEGVIYQIPDRRADHTNYAISIISLDAEEEPSIGSGRLLLRAERYPEYQFGDVLSFTARLEEPPEWDDFSYKDYLARQGISALAYRATDIELKDTGKANPLLISIYDLRDGIEASINRILHEPESSLLAGLLLGVKRGFSESFQESLRQTGTTHIIAISGYNISIIVILLQKLMQGLVPRKRQLWFFTFGIAVFVILVGASASVVRAALMGWLLILAAHVGRSSRVTSSLLVASALMMLIDPYTLWDLGFQLSFLATGGIIWIYPQMEKSTWYRKMRDWKSDGKGLIIKMLRGLWIYLWETLLLTLGAQVLVLPLLLWNFGEISVISPLVNLFVLFPIPWAMLAGFAAVLLSLLSQLLAIPVALLAWFPLHYIVVCIRWFARIPVAMLSFDTVPFWVIAAWYILVAVIIYRAAKAEDLNHEKT